MSDRVDLEVLRRQRGGDEVPRPRRRLWLRAIPVVLVLAFVAILFDALREQFTDPIGVTVIRPSVPDGAVAVSSGEVLFQAAGWVEPDPFPVAVTALANGVVETMLVQEGDRLAVGEPVARLVAEDAVIAHARAEALVARKRALLRRRRAELDTARASFEAALEVTEAVQFARGELKRHQAHHLVNRAALEEKKAELRVAELELETQRMLEEAGADGPWQKELAISRLAAVSAAIERLAAEGVRAEGQVESARARLERAEGDVKHRFAEKLRIETAEAELGHEEADAELAAQDLAEAALRLERMVVRAPVDGIVLTRDAHPGMVVGIAPESGPLCTLYDPRSLRVRVDVPQAQVGRVSRGLRAEIRADVRRGRPYRGEVLRVVDRADIQKVTLEVQVRVVDPDDFLKPEMLCQVSVLANVDESAPERRGTRVMIPRSAVLGDRVWVVDGATGRAVTRVVRTGVERGDSIEVLEGLNLTDKVIVTGTESLGEGARITIKEGGR